MADAPDNLDNLRTQLQHHLRDLTVPGVPRVVGVSKASAEIAEGVGDSSLTDGSSLTEYSSLTMDQLRKIASECRRCRLCEGRNRVVFGVGNEHQPLIAFVGEGPGADEDRVGEPFVGKAGKLLTAAITNGLGLARTDVYICNVVKCRPPENRTPLPDEVESCTPFLFRQLEIVKPKVIITLGQPAQLALTGVKVGITKLRGQWLEWRGIKVMPTFHPAYLLRNPPAKRFFWEDLQRVMTEVGLPAPRREGQLREGQLGEGQLVVEEQRPLEVQRGME